MVTFGWRFLWRSEGLLSWMIRTSSSIGQNPTLSATCDEILSRMIEILDEKSLGKWLDDFMWRIPWRALNSWARTLNRVGLRNCTKDPCKWTLVNLQTFQIISKIIFSTTPYYTSLIVHNLFPNLYNDIATLFSIEIVSHMYILSSQIQT